MRTPQGDCVCADINTRHCPVHGQGSPFQDRNSRVTKAEVGRIVHAARLLIEAHEKRSPTAEHTTLNEDTALFELNFQLGVYRTKNRMSR